MTILLASEIDPGANLGALLAFFACLSGIYLFGQGLRAWRRRQGSKAASFTTIRSIRPGAAEVQGIADGPHTMSAAVSGKDCYFYRTTIWREDSHKNGTWKKTAEETFALPFFLTDNTGRILLDARGAKVELPRDVYEEYGKTLLSTHTDIPERLEVFLTRHAITAGTAIRVEEYSIAPATKIFASGTIVKNTDGFDLSSAPSNRVEGGYCPVVRSAVPDVAPETATAVAEAKPQPEDSVSPVPLPAEPANILPANDSSKVTSNGTAPVAVQPEVIHLSLPSLGEPPEEMTMQSRLAAALRRANAKNPDTWGMPMPEVQATSVAIQELTTEPSPKVEAPSEQPAAAAAAPNSSVDVPIKQVSASQTKTPAKIPSKRPPALILRKGADGSELLLSAQTRSESAQSSAVAAALVFAGPALTLAGAYYLLLSFGWL